MRAKQSACGLALSCVLVGGSPFLPLAAADDVHLNNGEVIEGKATRAGDKVVIELESGQITLHAESVKHIDKRESSVERFEKLYSALKSDDVAKRMQLADFCREHDMRERERMLLQQVIEREPNHAEARARLGYVKSSTSQRWVTYAENMREKGYVQRDGQWLSPQQALEYDRMQASARAAAQANATQTELEAKRVELERQKLELERQRLEQDQRDRAAQPALGYYGYGYSYGYAPGVGNDSRSRSYPFSGPHFPLSGTRDPHDSSWSLSGVRKPVP